MKNLLCVFLVVVLFSCKSDSVDTSSLSLVSKWSVVSAKRNGELTTTLDKGFFEFKEEQFVTNILGDTLNLNYDLKDDVIRIRHSILKELKIEDFTKDSLSLSTKLSKYKFNFILSRE